MVYQKAGWLSMYKALINSIPWRTQLGVVAAGYAAVILLAALLVFQRHMVYVNHAADAAAADGMYAGGDLILALFIICLFFVPTFLLVLVIRQSEAASLLYGQVMLGLVFTAPLSLLIMLPTVGQSNGFFGMFCFYRLLTTPLVIVGLVISWLLSRFPRPKRLLLYALGIEAATLVICIGIFVFSTMHS